MSADHQDPERFTCCNAVILLGHDRTCKSKEQEPTDQDKVNGPCTWFDNEKMPQTMYVSIPLHLFSKNPSGTAFLRGWIEESVKGIALSIIKQLRIEDMKKAQRVIVPGGNGAGKPADLAVH